MTHASAGDSWTLIGKSGSVSCGVIAPLLLGPGAHKVLFPQSCGSSGGSMVGLMATSSSLLHLKPLRQSTADPLPPQFSSVAQSCPTLCDPVNCSTPGLPVHQLLEFTQTHVHQVSDAIQPSHPLSSPSPPAPNPSQHQESFPMSQLFA